MLSKILTLLQIEFNNFKAILNFASLSVVVEQESFANILTVTNILWFSTPTEVEVDKNLKRVL